MQMKLTALESRALAQLEEKKEVWQHGGRA